MWDILPLIIVKLLTIPNLIIEKLTNSQFLTIAFNIKMGFESIHNNYTFFCCTQKWLSS